MLGTIGSPLPEWSAVSVPLKHAKPHGVALRVSSRGLARPLGVSTAPRWIQQRRMQDIVVQGQMVHRLRGVARRVSGNS
jgi:hypothetical protein